MPSVGSNPPTRTAAGPPPAHSETKLVPAATSGYFRLVNIKGGLCADVQGGSTADGAKIIQWPANGGSNQEWQPVGL